MNTRFLHATKLSASTIQEINDALIVLRHFVQLNGRLLPLLQELTGKMFPSKRDLADIEKIKQVYQAYQFEADASEILMNSPILQQIKQTYDAVFSGASKRSIQKHMRDFQLEYDRLSKAWEHTLAN